MSSNNVYSVMLSSPKTVFTLQSLMMLTGNFDRQSLVSSLYYYKKKGLVLSPRSGIYVKPDYNMEELACSIFSFSYISLQYVLARAGVVFQYSGKVTCVSTVSRNLVIDGTEYEYRRIAPEIWAGMDGIERKEGVLIATPERAFLDSLYLSPGIGFYDNIGVLDREKIFAYVEDYRNKSLIRKIKKLYG